MTRKIQIVIGIGLVAALAVSWGLLTRSHTEADGKDPENGSAGEVVAAIVHAQRGTIENSLTIAGAFKPFQEVDIHAKVAGYIRTIPVDVGDHVREGQTIAVLEIPELAAELAGANAAVRRTQEEIRRAQGDVERAKSAHDAAHAMCQRLTQASQQRAGLVAQQEVDDAHAKDLEAEAQVSSAQAALSSAQQAQEMAPEGVRVVSAFHTVSASLLADLDHELDEDILMCGDRKDDKARLAELIRAIPGLRAVDAGPLEMARIVEQLTALIISINVRNKARAGIKITGLTGS